MFQRHSDAIGRTLRRQGLSAEAAEDATQQAFLIASERLDQIRPDRERAFLFGVVLRVTSSKRRRLARYQFEADMDVHPAPGSAQDSANERVLALELFNQVLERLDRDLAQAFVLFELEQLSKNEVARELGIPPGTAASRRRRARQTVEATMARLSHKDKEQRHEELRHKEHGLEERPPISKVRRSAAPEPLPGEMPESLRAHMHEEAAARDRPRAEGRARLG
jgi:RNA polymerase sigma-70 factor, ECF subfamily